MELFKRTKKSFDLEEKNENRYEPICEYNNLDININEYDKNVLISLEKDIQDKGKKLGEITYKIGESLEKAKKIFKKYSKTEGDPESFVNWYKVLGLNKDQVYIFRGRYNLCLKNIHYKKRIIELSDVAIKEVINKKTPKGIKEKVLEGSLKSGAEIKKARIEMIKIQKSRPLEIIDIENKSIKNINKKIENKLEEVKKLILNNYLLNLEDLEEKELAKKSLDKLKKKK